MAASSSTLYLLAAFLAGGDPAPEIDPGRLRDAVERGLRVVEKAARSYPRHRECFSCHHQTLPMQAMAAVRDRGLPADGVLLRDQAAFTLRSFKSRIERLRKGEDVGGAAMTVGYGLWTLDIAGWKPDETSDAMVTYLLKTQKGDGHWTRVSNRPPLEDSNVTCTVLAAYFMEKFGSDGRRTEIQAAVEKARAWLLAARPETQEDRNALLWGLTVLRAGEARIRAAREAVLEAQRSDGGWAQLAGMESDAYATGQTLSILWETGQLPPADPAYRRGVKFLLDTQLEDGSWHVRTRSKPIQTFFDNGDPHGNDQFISIPATSWATTALARAVTNPRLKRF